MARRRLSGGLRTLLGRPERKSLDSRAISSYRGYAVPGQPYNADWNTDRAVREGYQVNPYVFRAVEVCADNALARRIRLRRDDPDDGPIIQPDELDDPQRRLLRVMNRRTNPWEVAPIWRHRLVAQYLLSSRGVFVEAIRNRRDNVWGLLLLDPDLVEPEPTYRRDDRGREYVADPLGAFRVTRQATTRMGGEWQEHLPPWDPEQDHTSQPSGVIFVRSPHPTLLARGMSPMEAAGLSTDLDRHARMYNRRFLEQDGRPGGILGVKGQTSEATERKLQSRFQGGPEHAGRTTVIQADDMFWQDTSGTPRDTQWGDTMDRMRREISIAFGVPESVLGDASGRCVDMDTEALTQRGWLRGDEITTDDTILSMDPADGRLKWSPVHEVYRKPDYAGDMYRLHHIGALVSPGHKWVVYPRTRAQQSAAGDDRYTKVTVEDLQVNDRIITMGTAEAGVTEPEFSDAFVELTGWAVTEGHYWPNEWSRQHAPNKTAPYVKIRQNIGENADRIARCAKEAGATYIYRETDDGRRAMISVRGEVAAALTQVAPEKVLSNDFLLALTAKQRELLMQTMLDGDGCRQRCTASWTFAQKDRRASEAFVLLATLCGYTTSIRERTFTYRHKGAERPAHDWLVVVRQGKVASIQREGRSTEPYKGLIWCPRTSYGTFVARRHGKVFVTSNTFDNADSEFESFWVHKMQPLLRMLDAQLDVLTPGGYDDEVFLQHDVSDVYVLGRHKRAEQDRAIDHYNAGAIFLDDVREKLEKDPLNVPATRTLHIPPGKIVADDETAEHDGDRDAVAALPMMGTPQQVDPAAAAQAGAEQGSQLGARLAENNVASWRVMASRDRGTGALAGQDEAKQLAMPPPLPGQTTLATPEVEVEGEQSRAHPSPAWR